MAEILVSDLTSATVDGTGIFDTLMRANKTHLDEEYLKNRIKGSEYSTVYLGALESVMNASMNFLLSRQKLALEAQLMEQQILLAQVEVVKANAQVDLLKQQVINSIAELEILKANQSKVAAEVVQLTAQTALTNQQKTNLVAESWNIPKTGLLLDAKTCTEKATYNLTVENTIKTTGETALLAQKKVTETAQVANNFVPESVVGRQAALYAAQTTGFKRDAEQKAAKILVDAWNVQKTVDPGTKTDEAGVGVANVSSMINVLKAGVGAA